jgi:hypothetical protein
MVLKKIPTMEITKHGAIEFNYTDINFNNAIIVWHVCVFGSTHLEPLLFSSNDFWCFIESFLPLLSLLTPFVG